LGDVFWNKNISRTINKALSFPKCCDVKITGGLCQIICRRVFLSDNFARLSRNNPGNFELSTSMPDSVKENELKKRLSFLTETAICEKLKA